MSTLSPTFWRVAEKKNCTPKRQATKTHIEGDAAMNTHENSNHINTTHPSPKRNENDEVIDRGLENRAATPTSRSQLQSKRLQLRHRGEVDLNENLKQKGFLNF